METSVNPAQGKKPLRWEVLISGTVEGDDVPEQYLVVKTEAGCLARAFHEAQLKLRLELFRVWSTFPTGRLHANLSMEVDQWER